MATYFKYRDGFDISSNAYIDKRIVLTKAEMLTAEEDFIMPDNYFAYCIDDESWYSFNINNEDDPETGKYRQVTPKELVKNIFINSESVVDSEGIANIIIDYPVEDVLVDNASVMEGKRAKIDLSGKQDLLLPGDHIEINENRISALPFDHLEPKAGYGTFVDSEGHINLDNSVILTRADMPTELSDFDNDVPFITATVDNLTNYYLKSETYTKTEVNDLLSGFSGGINLEIVNILPLTGEANTIYLTRHAVGSSVYDQYVWFNSDWVQVGSTEIDLSAYYTKSEVDQLLAGKADPYSAGQGITISNNVISANIAELPVASPATAGVIKYDNNTIKTNAYGQIYADVQGGGKEYTAGENIYFTDNGTKINASTSSYTAGDGINIRSNNTIEVKTDDETVFTNRYGELYVDAIPIEAGDGIKIRNGIITVDRSTVPYESDLDSKQDKLVAGDNIKIVGNVISAIGSGGSEGGGPAVWGQISGTLSNQEDLQEALNNKLNVGSIPTNVSAFVNDAGYVTQANIISYHDPSKQDKLTPGANIRIDSEGVISAVVSSEGTEVNWGGIRGNINTQSDLIALFNTKADAHDIPTVNNKSIVVKVNNVTVGGFTTNQSEDGIINIPVPQQINPNNGILTLKNNNNVVLGTFSANQAENSTIIIPASGGGEIPNNGKLVIMQGDTELGEFTANQSSNVTVTIPEPPGQIRPNDGRLTIKRNNSTIGSFSANAASDNTINIPVPYFYYDEATGVLQIEDLN